MSQLNLLKDGCMNLSTHVATSYTQCGQSLESLSTKMAQFHAALANVMNQFDTLVKTCLPMFQRDIEGVLHQFSGDVNNFFRMTRENFTRCETKFTDLQANITRLESKCGEYERFLSEHPQVNATWIENVQRSVESLETAQYATQIASLQSALETERARSLQSDALINTTLRHIQVRLCSAEGGLVNAATIQEIGTPD